MNVLITSILLATSSLLANPFQIEFEKKEELTNSDWTEVQDKLKKLAIAPLLDDLYPTSQKNIRRWFRKPVLQEQTDFLGRMTRGARQVLIKEEEGKVPLKQLIRINQGGDCCIVSFASYNGVYEKQLRSIVGELEKTGWNGNFLLMTGGFPNPTGEEVRYAGVPYCFKIFAMLEAKKIGFQKALWIDAAMQPIQNPKPIFEHIEKHGSFFQLRKNSKRYLLPYTHEILLKETGIDMYKTKSVRARVIGLDFGAPQVADLISEYYRLVKLGTPFMSCFPEEHVLGALVAKHPEQFPLMQEEKLVKNEKKLHGKSTKWAEENQYFFLLRKH
jgi:hypothetical protein